jgi:hypothetical protein
MADGSVQRALLAAGWIGLVSGALIGTSLAASIAFLEGWAPGRDPWLLALHLTALYAIPTSLGLVAVAAVLVALGRRPGARTSLAVAAAFYLLLNAALRFSPAIQLLSITPHMNAIAVLDLAAIGVASAAAGWGVVGRSRRARLVALAAVAGPLLLLEGVHHFHERPRVRDLAGVPVLLARTPLAAPSPSPEPFEGARLVVLGLDGLSWEVLLPLLAQGELPGFRALLEGAAYGQLGTLGFAISPVVWETISTGQPPSRHGIGYHYHFEFAGLGQRVRRLPYFPLGNTFFGLRNLLSLTAGRAPWQQLPIEASDARRARLWEIASRAGLRVGVYEWLGASPLAPVEAFIQAYGPLEPKLHPPDPGAGLPALPAGFRAPTPGLAWVREAEPLVRLGYQRFVWLARRFRPEILLYYDHFTDAVNHVNWKQDVVGTGPFYAGLRHPEPRHGEAVVETMRFADFLVADAMSRVPAGAWLVIVSDHGFDYRGYEHDNAPPGVFILAGPGVEPGPFSGATVYDVAPTLLHLAGLPAAEDMPGRVLPVAAAVRPVEPRVASYGAAIEPVAKGTAREEELRRHDEYLRSLGYVN